jgi:hypothetical protein
MTSFWGKLPRVLLALALSAGLAACYETEYEVFGPKEAAIIPGLAGRYTDEQIEYVIVPIRHTPDYTFRDPSHPQDPPVRFRAVSLGNGLYIMQLQYDPKKPRSYWYVAFRVTREGQRITEITQLEPDDTAVGALAAQSGVNLTRPAGRGPSDPQVIEGQPAATAAFIKALASLPPATQRVLRRLN